MTNPSVIRARGLAVSALVIGTTLVAPVNAAAAPAGIDWSDCAGTDGAPGVQCATVTVAVDWADPASATLDIAVARRRATDPDRRVGTLMYLPGGPGQSGVDTLRAVDRFGGLESRFDLVSLDVRGVGRSAPLRCSTDRARSVQDLAAPPRNRREDISFRRRAATLAQDCAARSSVSTRFLDAASVARDVEAVRAALGEPTISLYAHSYGTLYAQKYAQTFPTRLRAAVLDGVFDSTLDRRTFLSSSAAALEDSFAEFAAWCGRDTECAVHGLDPGRIYDRLARRARAGRLSNAGSPVSPAELTATIDGMLLTPSWQAVGSYLRALDSGTPWESDPTPQSEDVTDYADPIVCRDIDLRRGYRDTVHDRIATRAHAPRMRFSPNTTRYANLCSAFPAPSTTNTAGPPELTTPMLLIGARHDNATPIGWARRVRDANGSSASLVEVAGWGHGMKVFNGGAEQRTLLAYLTHLVVPRDGTVIPGSLPPGIGQS